MEPATESLRQENLKRENRTHPSRAEVEELIFGSVVGAAVGAFLFGWIGAVLLTLLTGSLLRWNQHKRDTPSIPASLRQAVWIPVSAYEVGAALIERGEEALSQIQASQREQAQRRPNVNAAGQETHAAQTADGANAVAVQNGPLVDYLQRNAIGFVAAITIAVGFFMPWMRVFGLGLTGASLGNLSSEGNFAWVVFAGAVLIIVLYVLMRANRLLNVVVGALPWLLLTYFMIEADVGDNIFEVLAMGAYLTLGAGIALTLAPVRRVPVVGGRKGHTPDKSRASPAPDVSPPASNPRS